MPTSIIITLIICGTILIIWLGEQFFPKRKYFYFEEENRLGRYKMLLEALSELQQNPENQKSWKRLTSAINLISLEAPGHIVEEVVKIHDELMSNSGALSPESARRLLNALRIDVKSPSARSELKEFHIVSSKPAAHLINSVENNK